MSHEHSNNNSCHVIYHFQLFGNQLLGAHTTVIVTLIIVYKNNT